MEVTHVLFLRLLRWRGGEQQIAQLEPEVERFKGRLFKIEELPGEFQLVVWSLGVFLKYKGATCMRGIFRHDNKGWFLYPRNERQTPQEFVDRHNKTERLLAEEDPNYKPEFVELKGHVSDLGEFNAHDLGGGPEGPGADEKNWGVKN